MLDKTIEATAVQLQARHGMSGGRAVVKAEGTIVGKLAAGAGALLMFVAAGLALAVILKGASLTLMVLLVVGVIGFLGLVLFAVGMTLISRDAAPMIAAMGELLVKLVRFGRGGKNGAPPT